MPNEVEQVQHQVGRSVEVPVFAWVRGKEIVFISKSEYQAKTMRGRAEGEIVPGVATLTIPEER